MANPQPLVYDITPQEVPVQIGGVPYTLRECSGDAEIKYQNARFRARKTDVEGNTIGFDNLADTEALLVSLCLFDKDGKNPKADEVRSWPSRIMTDLFNRVTIMSELDSDDRTIDQLQKRLDAAKARRADSKKDSPSTEGGSG